MGDSSLFLRGRTFKPKSEGILGLSSEKRVRKSVLGLVTSMYKGLEVRSGAL